MGAGPPWLWLAVVTLTCAFVTGSRRQLVQTLLNDYDATERPHLNSSEPVRVQVQLKLNHIFNVDAKSSSCQVDLFIRQTWLDPRLSWNLSQFDRTLRVPVANLWIPDLGFPGAIKCEPTRDESIVVFYSGDVLYSQHVQCQFAQSYALQDFPFDRNRLNFRLQSFIYNHAQLELSSGTLSDDDVDNAAVEPQNAGVEPPLSTVTGSNRNCFDSVRPQDQLVSSSFSFSSPSCVQADVMWRPGRPKFSSITFSIYAQRQAENYVTKLVLPLFLLTVLSTLTYWIDLHSPPARTGFSVTILLAVVTFNLLVGQDLPRISYNTLLDWYVMLCFGFTFVAVAEFALVNHLSTSVRWRPHGDGIALVIDDFCQWTMSPVVLLANLVFFPLSPVLAVVAGIVLAGWVLFNVYRLGWNVLHSEIGFAICRRRPPRSTEESVSLRSPEKLASSVETTPVI